MNSIDSTHSDMGREIAKTIITGIRSPNILKEIYPTLFNTGVPDGALHAYVLSSLVLLGDQLGFSAVCDSPVFDTLDNLLLGEGSKRPDSVWFERGSDQPKILFEFERFKPGALEIKIKNLLIMSKSYIQELDSMFLIFWSEGILPITVLSPAIELSKKGFRASGCQYGPSTCPIVFIETVVRKNSKGLIIENFIVRQYIFGRENKAYIVDELNNMRY
jgi:hypothetical protein